MLQEYLRKIFDLLDNQRNILQSELKQLDQDDYNDGGRRSALADEVQREKTPETLVRMKELEGLERHIELRKRLRKTLQRSLEEMEKIRSELKQLEFRQRISLVELEAEELRKRRGQIQTELIPQVEQQMARLLDERKAIDSRLLNLNEEISLLRRRSKDVIETSR